jgi:hypothetical protein
MTQKCFSTTLVKGLKNTESILFFRRDDDKLCATSRLLSMDVVDITILGSKKKSKIR